MAPTFDEIVSGMKKRLEELKPLNEEYLQLEAALERLEGKVRPAVSRRTTTGPESPTAKRRGRPRGSTNKRQRSATPQPKEPAEATTDSQSLKDKLLAEIIERPSQAITPWQASQALNTSIEVSQEVIKELLDEGKLTTAEEEGLFVRTVQGEDSSSEQGHVSH